MTFRTDEVAKLLAECHRRCCICHRFCGVKIETDHMQPNADGGPDTIDNAIPVCFDCHAEIHSYNDQHPRGRKFRPDELRRHKDEWLRICREHPEVFSSALREDSVGLLQALIDELEFQKVHRGETRVLSSVIWPSSITGVATTNKSVQNMRLTPKPLTLKLVSEPFPMRGYKRIAVKVVDVYGNESTIVREL